MRVAFVVDVLEDTAFGNVVSLAEAMSKKWGGRFYQFIPAQNGKIKKEWLNYLAEYDPDEIIVYTQLNQVTLKALNNKTNPISVMRGQRFNYIESHSLNPVDVLPDANNTAALWRNPIQNPALIYFQFNEYEPTLPEHIRNFITLNIGKMSDDLAHRLAIGSSNLEIHALPSDTKEQFLEGMGVVEEWNRRIYPVEYSMLPGIIYESERENDSSRMSVFIGDSVMDLIYYWNSALLSPEWLSTKKNSIWLPTAFLEDEQLLNSVKKWIYRISPQEHSNSDVRDIKVMSSSVRINKLNSYAQKISQGQSLICSVSKLTSPKPPVYSQRISISEDMESFSVTGNAFTINTPSIELMQGGMGGQSWMVDVFIEGKDDNPYRQPAKEFWVQYPRDNNLASLLVGRTTVSRINRDNLLSMPVDRSKDSRRIKVEIPDSNSLLQSMLLGAKNSVHYNGDLRTGLSQSPFQRIAASNAGVSLRGAISLFDGLQTATNFFASRFWRDTFMTLAGSNPVGDPASREGLKNRVRKSLNKVHKPPTEKDVNAWVSTVITYSKDLTRMTDTKPFSFFKSLLDEEIERLQETDEEDIKDAEERLRQRLDWLIASKILSPGIYHKCRNCGLKQWYLIDSVNTENECVGCRYTFWLRAEEQWWYRLNSLIASDGGIYNQVPLIMALGEIYTQSKTSFDYFMPVDVYPRYSGNTLTDLDVIAIQDGELVIGEVKNSIGLFDNDELEKLSKAAKRIMPSKVVLFSPDATDNATTQNLVSNLKSMIGSPDVKVEWLFKDPIFTRDDDLWSI